MWGNWALAVSPVWLRNWSFYFVFLTANFHVDHHKWLLMDSGLAQPWLLAARSVLVFFSLHWWSSDSPSQWAEKKLPRGSLTGVKLDEHHGETALFDHSACRTTPSLVSFHYSLFSIKSNNTGAKIFFGNEKQDAFPVSNRQELAFETLPLLGFYPQGAQKDFPLVEGKNKQTK